MMSVERIRAIILAYWRYERQCPLVGLEVSCQLSAYNDGGQADIMAVTSGRLLIETEIKVSIGDLRKDRHKRKHLCYHDRHFDIDSGYKMLDYPASSFYFAVPPELANKAALIIEHLYPYAGIIIAKDLPFQVSPIVSISRRARSLHGRRLTAPQLVRMARAMSATCCRLANTISQNGG